MKLKSSLLTCGLLASFTALVGAANSDWPQWRGPHRDGISPETGLLKQWPTQGPPLAWKATGIGTGYSGVSVVDGKLFTMGDATDASFLYALDEATGKQLWAAKVGKAGGGGGQGAGPRCTPTVDGDAVFVLGQFGDLVCVESATGKERWRKNLLSDFGGKEPPGGWGYSESPLVDGDKVICTPGGPRGALIALNKLTGAELWRAKEFTDKAAFSSVVVAEIGGKRQYVAFADPSVVGVGAEDGKVLWRAIRNGRMVAVVPTPVLYENYVYVTSGYGIGCNLYKITAADGGFKADEVYANKEMINHHGGVIRVGENIYGYSEGKGWVCQDFKSGKTVWAEKEKLGKGSITYADGHFYLRSEGGKGTVALIEASPSGYKETGRFNQPDRSDRSSWPHPVIAHGKLYLRDQGVLLCYNVKGE